MTRRRKAAFPTDPWRRYLTLRRLDRRHPQPVECLGRAIQTALVSSA